MAENKVRIPYDALLKPTLDGLTDAGLLLVAQGKKGGPNAMAIGWASIGLIWGRPVLVVMVRPSRYTFKLLGENGDFTVNVMPEAMRAAVELCGTVSGRDRDKFSEGGMTALPGLEVKAPIIAESLIAYECRTVMTNDVNPETLDRSIHDSAYAAGDFHRVFFGNILAVRADPAFVGQ